MGDMMQQGGGQGGHGGGLGGLGIPMPILLVGIAAVAFFLGHAIWKK